MADDKVWLAYLAKYDKVYDPEGNDLAVQQQAAAEAQLAAMRLRFPPMPKPRARHW